MNGFVTSAIVLILLSGCSSIHLAPDAMRRKEYLLENKNTKDENFNKVQLWAAKAGGTIRLNDRKSGDLVLKANVPCHTLEMGNGYAKDVVVWFVLETNSNNKKVRLVFNDIKGQTLQGWDTGLRPSSQKEVDAVVSGCLEPIKDSLVTVL